MTLSQDFSRYRRSIQQDIRRPNPLLSTRGLDGMRQVCRRQVIRPDADRQTGRFEARGPQRLLLFAMGGKRHQNTCASGPQDVGNGIVAGL